MRQFPRRVGRWCRAGVLALLLTSVLTVTASAHDPGLSSLDVSLTASTIVARLSLSPRDAEMAAALEPDGRFADAEWAGAAATLGAFARRTIELQIDGQRLSAGRAKVERVGDATVIVELTYARPIGSRLTVRSRVAEQFASGHRELVTVRETSGTVVSERMIGGGDGGEPIALDVPGGILDLAHQFFVLGLQHILSGYDHLLFLAGLLLGVHGLRRVVMTATAFTIGHSLTLVSAVLGIVALPAGLVEPLIAASIAYVGVENLVSTNTSSRWRTALAFGLIHGFGFAGALQELGVGSGGVRTVVPLGFFNLGVEAGQVAVALMVLPVSGTCGRGRHWDCVCCGPAPAWLRCAVRAGSSPGWSRAVRPDLTLRITRAIDHDESLFMRDGPAMSAAGRATHRRSRSPHKENRVGTLPAPVVSVFTVTGHKARRLPDDFQVPTCHRSGVVTSHHLNAGMGPVGRHTHLCRS